MSAVGFPIVGIGTSAGGLNAFHTFFGHMPADCNMATLIEPNCVYVPPPHALVSLARVFTMFTRIDSGTNRTESGLGIGLALAKGLRRGGETLPPKRILIADDNRDGAETLGLYLDGER